MLALNNFIIVILIEIVKIFIFYVVILSLIHNLIHLLRIASIRSISSELNEDDQASIDKRYVSKFGPLVSCISAMGDINNF